MLREGFNIVLANRDHDPVLRNLFEFYLHDMAEWFKFDQLPNGTYTQSMETYWGEGHDVYLLFEKEIPIGFGFVGPAEEWLPGRSAKDMDEFFVVRRHRRVGVSQEFAMALWMKHRGPWLVRVFQPNLPALPFWRSTIANFTSGHYVEETQEKNGDNWSYFSFDSADT